MRVVQWNSHHGGKRSDGTLDTAGFGQALARLQPDVVCLNEVEQFDGYGNHDAAGLMAAALGADWRAYTANQSGIVAGKGISNAILARLPDVGSVLGVKPLFDARVALALKVRGVTIVAVHLDNEQQASRIVETCQLLAWDAVRDASPLILAGDFNAAPTSVDLAPYRYFYKDAWVVASDTGKATAFNKSGYTKSSRIDAIFYRGVTLQGCAVPDTRPSADAAFPSDHHPVVATFA